jgi:hypothetical protein
MLSFLKAWMLSFSSVEDVIIFHGVNIIIFKVLDVIIFECKVFYHFLWCKCYHFESLDVIILYGVNVYIFEGLDVIIFECRGCYHFSILLWCKFYLF